MPCVLTARYYVCYGLFAQCKLGIRVCNTNLEFILQVTIKLISLLNLVNFMEYVTICCYLNEIYDCLQEFEPN
jgi:hypothetical protein